MLAVFVVLLVASTIDVVVRGGSADALLIALASGVFGVTGAVVASRHRADVIGWVLLAIAVTSAVTLVAETYIEVPARPGRAWVGWVAAWMWMVWTSLVAVFLPLLFPTGRLPSRRWRPALWLGTVALGVQAMAAALDPGQLQSISTELTNPLGLDGAAGRAVEAALVVATALWALSFLAAAASFVARLRGSRGVEREQLKWVAYASVIIGIGGLGLVLSEVVPPGPGDQIGGIGYLVLVTGLWVGMPLAVAIAVLRHRLFDIDLVINRTLVYGSLTVLLATTYLAGVLLLQVGLSPLTRDVDLAVAVSTLAVAGLFRPLRSRVQRLVDRRFYRRRYDGQRTVEAFAVRLRSQLDLHAVGEDLREVVTDTVQPAHVSLWLRGTP